MNNLLLLLVVFPVFAYVIGSTPFGVIIARFHGVDLRKTGSGNVGATNVGRTMGRQWGYTCFLLDVLKGFVPVILLVMMTRPATPEAPARLVQAAWLLAGCGAIMGHVFSFWLRGRGGKGVSTALGVVLGIYPYFTLPGVAALAIWIVVTLASRYVSVGSVVAAVAFLPLMAFQNRHHIGELWPLLSFALVMIALIIFRHRTNMRRLLDGTENKIGKRA